MDEIRIIVEPGTAAVRIDKYLAEADNGFSRSFLQKLLKEGMVSVNQKQVKANFKISPGDEIVICVPEQEEPDILPENIPLSILYEDKDLIIVNKPKGMVVHPAVGHYTGTLVNALMYHCREDLSGINGVTRPGIVHRIDQNTTGSLVVCKNDFTHNDIAEQLKVHSITRKYRAIVHGNIKEDQGTVDVPIGRHPKDRKKMAIDVKNGRNAVTHWKVLERFGQFTYIECQLETGRTHQIRVHMSSIQHPILGDDVYGPAKCPISGLQGQTLHAMVLGFRHPRTGEYLEVSAPLPEYFQEILEKFRK